MNYVQGSHNSHYTDHRHLVYKTFSRSLRQFLDPYGYCNLAGSMECEINEIQ
jgi:hypothetical protein